MKKLLLALFFTTLISCNSNEKYASYEKEVKFIDASSFTSWTYYAFRGGKVVQVEDFKNSANWDIAFHRSDVRFNGGASRRQGKGAYYLTNIEKLSQVTEVPKDINFILDGEKNIVIGRNSEGEDILERQPASSLEWVLSDGTIQNKVFIIRTEDGGIIKLKFSSYNNKGRDGFISFKYNFLKK